MNDFRNIWLPLVRNFPIWLTIVLIALGFAYKAIPYIKPSYQGSATIKIDFSQPSTQAVHWFSQEASAPGNTSQTDIATALEILNSKSFLKKVFKNSSLQTSYFRIGEVKTTELYNDAPFKLITLVSDASIYDKWIYLTYVNPGSFLVHIPGVDQADTTIVIDQIVSLEALDINIMLNDQLIAENKSVLQVGDQFGVRLHSPKYLASQINATNYYLKPLDKEIPILKVYYENEVPTKAVDFLQLLLDRFSEEMDLIQKGQSKKTLAFLTTQMEDVFSKLNSAESMLAAYKVKNGILDNPQQVDTWLKEQSGLELQLVSLEGQIGALEKLYQFLISGQPLDKYSPNIESLQDPIFKKGYTDILNLEMEKKDLQKKYTDISIEVQTVDEKIKTLRAFLSESVKNTFEKLQLQKGQMQGVTEQIQKDILALPTQEQRIGELERKVKLYEDMYKHLFERKTELEIITTSNNPTQMVLEAPKVGAASIWPNKPLIYGVALFIGLVIGLPLAYFHFFFLSKIRFISDLKGWFTTEAKLIKENSDIAFIVNEVNKSIVDSTDTPIVLISSAVQNKTSDQLTSSILSKFQDIYETVTTIDIHLATPELGRWGTNPWSKDAFESFKNEHKAADVILLHTSTIQSDDLFASAQQEATKHINIFPKGKMNKYKMKKLYDQLKWNTQNLIPVISKLKIAR